MSFEASSPRVTGFEVLITLADGSAVSLSTTDAAVIDNVTIVIERDDPPPYDPWAVMRRNPPVVELTVKVDGPDIRWVQQHHPAPKEGPT